MRADGPEHVITVVCECGRLGCNELIGLSRAEYERVRSNAQRFAIVPGPRRPRGRGRRRAPTAATRTFEKHADVDDVRQAHGPAPVANADSEVERGARKRDGDPG